jgi:hypothetical protein
MDQIMHGASATRTLWTNLRMYASLSCVVLKKYYEDFEYFCIYRIPLKSHETNFLYERYCIWMLHTDTHEELDGPAASVLGVRSRKLNNVLKGHRMGDQNLLSRVPPCFGRHVKPLIPVAFALVSTHSTPLTLQLQGGLTSCRRPIVKIIAESLSQHNEKRLVWCPR